MTSKKKKIKKRDKTSSKILREKPEPKTKPAKISGRKKQPEGLEELALTWDEDLCE